MENKDEFLNNIDSKNINSSHKRKLKPFYKNLFRAILLIPLLLLFLIPSLILFNKSLSNIASKEITYTESGNTDYKVYLKENDYYESEYLESGMLYIASLIDKINVNFKYNFNIDQAINAKFDYNITGTLVITDNNEENTYYSKEYVLLDSKTDELNSGKIYKLDKTVSIDYDYYNKLAQKFINSYKVDATSNLIVTLNVSKSSDNNYKEFDVEKSMSLKIPLTEKSININISPIELDTNTQKLSDSGIIVNNPTLLVLGIILLIISIIIFIRIVIYLSHLFKKKTKYQRKVARILKTYDRLIANVKTMPDFEEFNIVKVENFEELVDIRDNIKLPVMYYEAIPDTKCYFYITYEDTLYLYTLKAVDLENKDEK